MIILAMLFSFYVLSIRFIFHVSADCRWTFGRGVNLVGVHFRLLKFQEMPLY